VILGLYEPREAPEVVAIRVVETLRATLLDFEHPRSAAPQVPMRPSIPVEPPASPGPARLWLGVGGGGAYSSGGLGAMGHLDLSLTWTVRSRFTVAIDGALSPAPAKMRAPEGEANVAWYLAGLSLGFNASNPEAPLRFARARARGSR